MRNQILALTLLTVSLSFSSVPSAQAQGWEKFNFHIGGGIGTPLGSTSDFAGVSGAFQIGAGTNLSERSSIIGEFMWHGLPPDSNALRLLVNPLINGTLSPNFSASSNLYALTANYRYHKEGEMYGYYLIGGGGWYYRKVELLNYVVAPGTVCEPAWDWWGYSCYQGFVSTENVLADKGVASGGVNGGVGMVIKLGKSNMKWYMEARYHYSPQGGQVATHVLPVTFGLRW